MLLFLVVVKSLHNLFEPRQFHRVSRDDNASSLMNLFEYHGVVHDPEIVFEIDLPGDVLELAPALWGENLEQGIGDRGDRV